MKVKPMTIIVLCTVPEGMANHGNSQKVGDAVQEMVSRLGVGVELKETLVRYTDPRPAREE